MSVIFACDHFFSQLLSYLCCFVILYLYLICARNHLIQCVHYCYLYFYVRKQYHKKFQSCRKVERSADGFEVGKSDIYNLTNHHNTSGSFLTVKSTELTIPLL